jgi:hypothetical protein
VENVFLGEKSFCWERKFWMFKKYDICLDTSFVFVCLCVCEREIEREREFECVCVCVCV